MGKNFSRDILKYFFYFSSENRKLSPKTIYTKHIRSFFVCVCVCGGGGGLEDKKNIIILSSAEFDLPREW